MLGRHRFNATHGGDRRLWVATLGKVKSDRESAAAESAYIDA
jgi:hypothetical protein